MMQLLLSPHQVLCCAELHDLLPSILAQLGATNIDQLRKFAQNLPQAGATVGGGPPGSMKQNPIQSKN